VASTSSSGAVASAVTVGKRAIQRCQYGITVATRVCCSMISLTQMAYGSRTLRHGKSRFTWR
jgi:hypothetical protein